jgi:hypothetical protein
MTLRVREKEQRKMATLVAKQSQQMLELLAAKQEELKQEVVKELVSIRKNIYLTIYIDVLTFIIFNLLKINVREYRRGNQ